MSKVAKSIKKGLEQAVAYARVSKHSWAKEVMHQLKTDKKFAKLLTQKLVRDGEDPASIARLTQKKQASKRP